MKFILDLIKKLIKFAKEKDKLKVNFTVHLPTKKATLDIPINVKESISFKGIVWHHSLSADNVKKDWGGIVRYHTSYRIDFNIVSKEEFEERKRTGQGKYFQKPWRAVGYHAGSELVHGKPYFQRGRDLTIQGAHSGVKGVSNYFNQNYLGLCSIGNFDVMSPSPELWDFNLRITRTFMDAFGFTSREVVGHREVYEILEVPVQKTCPGKQWNMELFRREL